MVPMLLMHHYFCALLNSLATRLTQTTD